MFTLSKREKSILIVVAFIIFTSLITWGLYVLYRKLVTPPCPEGQKRYSEYGNSCFPDCPEGTEVCPKKDTQGNTTQITCVKNCADGTTYSKDDCNDPGGYCVKTCPPGQDSVKLTSGWDCGIPCPGSKDIGFPNNYCNGSKSYCGKEVKKYDPPAPSSCISGEYAKCGTSDYYCPDAKSCTPTPSGYYCAEAMCN